MLNIEKYRDNIINAAQTDITCCVIDLFHNGVCPHDCKDCKKAADAANALKITASDLLELGIIDECVKEPMGGAHNDKEEMAKNLKKELISTLKKLTKMSPEKLRKQRYAKYRKMGCFLHE